MNFEREREERMCRWLFKNQLSSRLSLGKDTRGERRQIKKQRRYRVLIAPTTRERERERKRGRRAVILNAPRLGKKETAESLVLSVFSSRTHALDINVPSPSCTWTSHPWSPPKGHLNPSWWRRRGRRRRSAFFYFMVRLLGIFVKTQTPKKRGRGGKISA